MSLATRCGKCGTVFRVVQDQLKMSEGWVRCGRCGEVFNALEGLFDLEGSSGPMPLMPSTPAAAPPAPPPIESVVATREAPIDMHDDTLQDAPTTAQIDTQSDTQADARGESGFGRSRPVSRFDDIDLINSLVPEDAVSAPRESEPAASFLREAEREEQWERPRVRRSLWVLSGLLGLVLAAQIAVAQRDTLAVRWPGSAPLLGALCATLGCTIEAPRTLDALLVDSSGLARVDGAPLYRLQVTLRNRGATPVMVPALDVTLTDSRGEVVARRALRAADLGAGTLTQLSAGGEWPINALLDVGGARVTGYTIELFYP